MGRPAPRFGDYIGHKKIIDLLKRELEGAIALKEPMPHILLKGRSGVGKTRLARVLATERGTRLRRLLGRRVTWKRLVRILLALRSGDFLFVDEAHAIEPAQQELLYEAIDRHRIPLPKGKGEKRKRATVQPFTLILATDQPFKLLPALRARIPTKVEIPPYPLREMREIIATIAARKRVLLTPQATGLLARVCGGIPRSARDYLAMLRCYYPCAGHKIEISEIRQFLRANGISAGGFDRLQRKYLRELRTQKSASLITLALLLDTNPAEVRWYVEPLLVQRGLVVVTSTGRRLTHKGREWVDRRRQAARKKKEKSTS